MDSGAWDEIVSNHSYQRKEFVMSLVHPQLSSQDVNEIPEDLISKDVGSVVKPVARVPKTALQKTWYREVTYYTNWERLSSSALRNPEVSVLSNKGPQ